MRRGVDRMRRHSVKLAVVGGATAVVLAGGSAAAMAVAGGSLIAGNAPGQGATSTLTSRSCTVPALAGSVVDVKLTDMGSAMHRWARRSGGYGGMMGGSGPSEMTGGRGPGYPMGGQMMGGRPYGHMADSRAFGGMMGGQWRGRMMQVRLSRHSVPARTVSLRVSDVGVMDHELVVLPLTGGARVGRRTAGPQGTLGEHGSLGEVSNDCGAGAGDGLHPGDTGWTTLQLRPGRYELVCNLPGHYAAGMFAALDVTQ